MIVTRYQKRISGLLLDSFESHKRVFQAECQKLRDMLPGEYFGGSPGGAAAWESQRERFAWMDIARNAEEQPAEVRQYCTPDESRKNVGRVPV